MRILVAIASYGPYRFGYLDKVITTYQRMPHRLDLVVHSDRGKRVPQGTRLVVGLPTPDPARCRSPTSACSPNARTTTTCSSTRKTTSSSGSTTSPPSWKPAPCSKRTRSRGCSATSATGRGVFFVDAHPPWDWVAESVAARGGSTFATFSNAHSGCYVLTRSHLRRVVRSGGYLVPPHDGFCGLRESAATDP